ncbi:LacI family DNA-binding transcriptional regulator [Halobacillus seohaensis]|uniref:LacI family DNA-binding transcriptional regulator n=1 Tax=Halobacillus seohaensis TaxID=447421 RepID=A0ABW2ELW9_9BACI
MARKITIQQIADYLGVSKYVVSRALSGRSGVKEETKEKVFQAASKLGYFIQNSRIKSSNVQEFSREKKNILVVMPNTRQQMQESSYWGGIIDGIRSSVESKGFGVIIITEGDTDDLSAIINLDAVLGLIGVGKVSTSLLLKVRQLNFPIVLIDHEDRLLSVDTVFTNNFDSSAMLTDHLIGLGHKRIWFLGNITYSRSFFDRWLGFRSALELSGMTAPKDEATSAKNSDDMCIDTMTWMESLQQDQELPTAIMCANDSIAIELLTVLKELSIDVPGEISVTGFDNIEDSYLVSPTLTTVHVPKEQIGKRAVKALFARLYDSESPGEKTLLSCESIFRESTLAKNE